MLAQAMIAGACWFGNWNMITIRRLVLLTMAFLPLMTTTVSFAQQTPPNRFGGTVTFGGEPVPDGAFISAIIDGVAQGGTNVSGGRYVLDVHQGSGTFITFLVNSVPAIQTAIWEMGGVTKLDLTMPPATCVLPSSGNWVIAESCTIEGTATAPANVIVEGNIALIIAENAALDIDFSNFHLLIKTGAKVVIKDGGKIH